MVDSVSLLLDRAYGSSTGFTQVTSYAPGNVTGPVAVGANVYLSN
jgi:hypothetical protein